ncbi:MAG: Rrf2 family transcriptional regulator [Planctomycetota bacterium]
MIPISRSSEYAIRALTYLAMQEPGLFCLARDMADELGIPAPFLGKVFQPLVARGLLVSQRGRHGGFRLARPAGEITVYEIVDAQEHLDRPAACFLGQAECTDERACPMHDYWTNARDTFLRTVSSLSLKSMLEFRERLPQSNYPSPIAAREPASDGHPASPGSARE